MRLKSPFTSLFISWVKLTRIVLKILFEGPIFFFNVIWTKELNKLDWIEIKHRTSLRPQNLGDYHGIVITMSLVSRNSIG